MTVFVICGNQVTAHAAVPATLSEGEVIVGSAEEIAASRLSLGQMVAIWNALPGKSAISKFKDRKPPRNACGRPSRNCRLNRSPQATRPMSVAARSRRR